MRLQNVSGLAVKGSDIDYNLWLASRTWELVTGILARLRIGQMKRARAYVIEVGRLEIFIVDRDRPDYVTLIVEENARTQREWTRAEKDRFVAAKRQIENLENGERKAAKELLVEQFGLCNEPYRQRGKR